MAKVRSFLLDGVLWRIQYIDEIPSDDPDERDLEGLCQFRERLISIRTAMGERIRLETELHELIHAVLPKMRHKKVHILGYELAKILWFLGYRRVPRGTHHSRKQRKKSRSGR